MTKTISTTRRRRQRGQGLAEMGLVVLLLVTLTAGIVEFGRMLMMLNMITNATRDAARAAAAVDPSNRCASNGNIASGMTSTIQSMVTNQLEDVGLVSGTVTVTITHALVNGVPMVTVNTVVPVPWIMLFNLVGTNLDVNRSVTFRDEQTTGTQGC